MHWASPAFLATRNDPLLFGLNAIVVLLAIDLAAGAILLAVDLAFLLASQFATVGLAIGVNLLIDALFAIFGAGGFTGGHLAAANALRDAVLLVCAALADFVVAVVGGVGVVLVVVDGAAEIILLAIDLATLLWSELAAVGRAVGMNFAIEIGFATFEVLSFAGSELTGLDAVGDTILLVFAPVVDRVGGLRCGGLALLREGGTRSNEGSNGERDECPVHAFLHGPCFVACGPR